MSFCLVVWVLFVGFHMNIDKYNQDSLILLGFIVLRAKEKGYWAFRRLDSSCTEQCCRYGEGEQPGLSMLFFPNFSDSVS